MGDEKGALFGDAFDFSPRLLAEEFLFRVFTSRQPSKSVHYMRHLLSLCFNALAAAAASTHCSCFSLCTPEEVRHFLLRLPRVESPASPWYEYLLAVYNTDAVPLPVDLRTFGAFQLPLDAETFGQLRIPWAQARCHGAHGRSSAPVCTRAVCERWLNLTSARKEEVAAWEAIPLPKSAWPAKELVWPEGRLPVKGFSMAAVPRDFAARFGLPIAASAASFPSSSHVAIRVLLDGQVNPGGQNAGLEPYHLYLWPENSTLRMPHPPDTWVEAGRFFYDGR